MTTTGERIKEARKAKNMTQSELADKVGVRFSAIHKYENGLIVNLKRDTISALAQALDVSPSWLMCLDDDSHDAPPTAKPHIRVPVLGRVAAGIPIEAIEDVIGWEDLPASWATGGAEYFALLVKGDSMEPKISDGDIVIVRKQPDAETGDVAVVLINGNDATIKKIKKAAGGLTLIPSNPAYDVLFFTADEVKELPVAIIGRVVELRAKM